MRCLFLGYNRKKTKLIKLLETKGYKVSNINRKISFSDIENNDLYISFGYRKIIPKKIIQRAKRPIINLHLSFLPFNRGAHPNFWSFIEDTPSGVSIHEIDDGVDTGPIIFQKKIKFDYKKNKNITFKSTYNTLFKEVESLFVRNINKLVSNNYKIQKQKKIFSVHKKKDLPKNIKSWSQKIFSYKKNFYKLVKI
jgi:methionyl-tRNA formyltransferase